MIPVFPSYHLEDAFSFSTLIDACGHEWQMALRTLGLQIPNLVSFEMDWWVDHRDTNGNGWWLTMRTSPTPTSFWCYPPPFILSVIRWRTCDISILFGSLLLKLYISGWENMFQQDQCRITPVRLQCCNHRLCFRHSMGKSFATSLWV